MTLLTDFFHKVGLYFMGAMTAFSLLPAMFSEAKQIEASSRAWQIAHVQELREKYKKKQIKRVNEQSFVGFNINDAVRRGVKYNQVQFLATHNSYKRGSSESLEKMINIVSKVGIYSANEFNYAFETLTEQLNAGIRSIELDVVPIKIDGSIQFICCHTVGIDMNSSCLNLDLALEEIALWSKNNPGHMPISVLIEPKDENMPVKGLRAMTLKNANLLDSKIKAAFGKNLLTPADMMGKHASLGAMRKANDWLPLGDTLGKVMVLLHSCTVTQRYINQDKALRSQSMFPMLRYADRDKDYASFMLINKAKTARQQNSELIDKNNLIVRIRLDIWPQHTKEEYNDGIKSGSQILTTDYPPRNLKNAKDKYVAWLDGKYTCVLAK